MKDTIYFRTAPQKVLYDKEIRGQISDGHWENEDTDHRLWYCITIVRPKKVGISWKPECNLDFNDDDLVDNLGERMREYVLSGYRSKYTTENLRKDLEEMTNIVFSSGSDEEMKTVFRNARQSGKSLTMAGLK